MYNIIYNLKLAKHLIPCNELFDCAQNHHSELVDPEGVCVGGGDGVATQPPL